MGRYISHPLTVQCRTLEDVRRFLRQCKSVSDEEQFDRRDHWQPPEEFEKTRKGDCDCFALWTWRQLLEMGYDARFVIGQCGRYGTGHAWVQFFQNGTCYLLEPQLRMLGSLPRMSTLWYHPRFSVASDGEKLSYYKHEAELPAIGAIEAARLLPEYLWIWGWFWLRNLHRLPKLVWRSAESLWDSHRVKRPKAETLP